MNNEQLNLHSSDITNLLKKLCVNGFLESDKNGRWTTYKLKQKVDTSDQKVASSNQKVDTSEQKVATSEKTIENQYLKELETLASSEKKVATSREKVATSNTKVDTLQHELKEIYGKNIKREDLEVVILKLCESRYVKKEELASLLGKSENYIRNRILPDLLKNGKLEKRFPFTHNHPEQGYKTSEEHAKEL